MQKHCFPILVVVAALWPVLFIAPSAPAQVPQIINYQGRIAVGSPAVNFDGSGQFKFALTNGLGSTYYWTSDGTIVGPPGQPTNAVTLTVTNGLYSVLLGDTTVTNMTALPTSAFGNSDVRLRVWFNDGTHGFQLLSPDQRLAAVGYAMTAAGVPNNAITSSMIANGAVGASQLASGAVGVTQLAAGAFSAPVSVSGTSQTAAANTAYVATNAAQTSFTLPATANVGDTIQISGAGAGGWAVWTQQTNSLPAFAPWRSVASSADGSHLVAVVDGGGIYTSANSGASWTQTSAPNNLTWGSVASSADGSHLVAGVDSGGIYTSADYGASWTQTSAPNNLDWQAVASSADGSHLVAVVAGGGIYTSANYGTSWTQTSAPNNLSWQAVASSADGSHLVAGVYSGWIYTSANAGASWTQTSAPNNLGWWSVASSADGSHLVAVVAPGGGIYTSADYGASWTQTSAPNNLDWQAVASSADGSHLVAVVASGGGIYTSADYGASWTQTSAPNNLDWQAVASSADGSHLVAVVYHGRIYTQISGAQGTAATLEYVGNSQWVAATAPQLASATSATQLELNGKVSLSGATMTGSLTLPADSFTVGTNEIQASDGNVNINTPSGNVNINSGSGNAAIKASNVLITGGTSITGNLSVTGNNQLLVNTTSAPASTATITGRGSDTKVFDLLSSSSTDLFNVDAFGNATLAGTAKVNGNLSVAGNSQLLVNTAIAAGNTATITARSGDVRVFDLLSPTSTDLFNVDPAGNATLAGSATVSGNFGVGTSVPTVKVDVNGPINVFDSGLKSFNGGMASEAGGSLVDFGINDSSQNRFGGAYSSAYPGGYFRVDARGPYPLFQFAGRQAGSTSAVTDLLDITSAGNVGIGTSTPTQAKLVVSGSANTTLSNFGYLSTSGAGAISGSGGSQPYSIYASARIAATEVDAYSDERIKNIIAVSDRAADLKTLLGLRITDYTYKDTIGKGDRPQKKVIAQQVEKVFPQAVSRITDAVPDIFTKAAIAVDGWIALKTDLKKGDRVRLIAGTSQGVYEVLEVATDGARFRTAFQPEGEEVFVYGRQVADFRVVDYDAISTLNVSATQELARRLEKCEAENAALKQRLEVQKAQLAEMGAKEKEREARLSRLENLLPPAGLPTAVKTAATNR